MPPSRPRSCRQSQLTCCVFLVFSLHCGRLAAPCPPQNQQPTLRLESRRRIGGKIIKILHCGQKPVLSQTTAEKEQRRTYLRDETPFTLTAGREKQQRGPSSRKQSLTEAKHEKKRTTELENWSPWFCSSAVMRALTFRVTVPTHCPPSACLRRGRTPPPLSLTNPSSLYTGHGRPQHPRLLRSLLNPSRQCPHCVAREQAFPQVGT